MSSRVRYASSIVLGLAVVLGLARSARAQELPPLPPATPEAPPPATPATPTAAPPATPPSEHPTLPAEIGSQDEPAPRAEPVPVIAEPVPVIAEPEPELEPEPEPMSEGRRIVVAYNTGFQWGLSPGVVFTGDGKASFFLGVRLGYGIDTGSVIVVPGVRLAAYFTDPNVFVGMPIVKLVLPVDHFAPFIEGGIGGGYVSQADLDKGGAAAQAGASLLAGAGFMIHFSWKFGLGVEANYQTITGTDFHGFGVGPILALGF